MILTKLEIKAFGNLRDLTLEPGEGVNLLQAPNESGKSTLAAFLKFIFYGLGKSAVKGELAERERYIPWESESAAGSAELMHEGKLYRIERTVTPGARGARAETLSVLELPQGSPVEGDPAELFLGVPETVFRRSAFVSQSEAAKMGGGELQEAIENILFSADEETNTKKALKKLEEARVLLLYKNEKGGKIYDLRQEEEALDGRLGKAKSDGDRVRAMEATLTEQTGFLEEKRKRCREAESQIRHTDALRRLRQVDAAREAEDAVSAAEEDWAKLRAENGGRSLTKTDLEALDKLDEDYRREKATAEEAAATGAELEKEISEAGELPDLKTGRALLEQGRETEAKGKTLRVFGVILMALAALAGAAAAFLLLSKVFTTAGIAAAVAAFCLLGAGLALLLVGLKKRRAALAGYASFGAGDAGDLADLLAVGEEKAEALHLLEAERKAAARREETASARQTEVFAAAKKLLRELDPNRIPADPTAIAGALRDLRERYDAEGRAYAKIEAAKATAAALRIDCSEAEETTLRELLATDGIDGELGSDAYDELKRNYNFERQTARMIDEKIKETERQLTELRVRAEDPGKIAGQILSVREERAKLEKLLGGYQLAREKLEEASDNLRRSVSPTLTGYASHFMESATGGRYGQLLVDEKLGLRFRFDGQTREAGYLSGGTADLAYISLRMALVELLHGEKRPPLVFDESFSRLDDARLETVLRALAAYPGQIFLLTSHKREARVLSGIADFTPLTLA